MKNSMRDSFEDYQNESLRRLRWHARPLGKEREYARVVHVTTSSQARAARVELATAFIHARVSKSVRATRRPTARTRRARKQLRQLQRVTIDGPWVTIDSRLHCSSQRRCRNWR